MDEWGLFAANDSGVSSDSASQRLPPSLQLWRTRPPSVNLWRTLSCAELGRVKVDDRFFDEQRGRLGQPALPTTGFGDEEGLELATLGWLRSVP